ncbi:heavy-metal-associated domain-containing protein [Microvirga rosea]|uniref:heavy-metal-associated domain-containing protein n=1 Tax=Microvirga rosea TaxID=2715425 RepID=UPI001D09BFB6|nr:heavy-metal-associated domain-containing protein [Microvirga rosea]MCB8819766.1 heavy-metal-associated domain-containing protein [Microvirga rosea]
MRCTAHGKSGDGIGYHDWSRIVRMRSPPEPSHPLVEHHADALTLQVEDTTCRHCAGTIKKTIETGLPGTSVAADPTAWRLVIHGLAKAGAVMRAQLEIWS